jgi:hypothetical protein
MRAIVNIFATAALVLFAQQAIADPYAAAPAYDPSADWCTEDLPYSLGKEVHRPDGAITQVGAYLFRVCQGGPPNSTPDERVMRFFYNPERVEGLSSVKVMTGLMINSVANWEDRVARVQNSYHLTGELRIGSVIYDIYRFILLEGTLSRPIFLYLPELGAGSTAAPSHMFHCTEPVLPPYQLHGRCFIEVGFDQLYTNLLFISPLSEDPPIPVDRFSEFAQDVWRTLDAANVTDEYDELPPDLPFLD